MALPPNLPPSNLPPSVPFAPSAPQIHSYIPFHTRTSTEGIPFSGLFYASSPATDAINELKPLFGDRVVTNILKKDKELKEILEFRPDLTVVAKEIFFRALEITPERLSEKKGTIDERVGQIYTDKSNNRALIWDSLERSGFNAQSLQYDRAQSSGKGFQGRAEKIGILWKHHEQVQKETNPERGFLRDIELLTSRLGDREMDKDTIIHLMDGYYVVDKNFVSGGAFVSALKGLEGQSPKIVCRGTAMRWSATGGYLSGVNDISGQIGQLGVQSIWTDIKQYIQDNGIKNIEVLGKSLGGGHAQALAVLLEGHGVRVDHLITYASVGVADEINQVFNEEILANKDQPMKITVIRNGGLRAENEVDYIPLLGGAHLGANAAKDKVQSTIYYIGLENSEIEFPNSQASRFEFGRQLVSSLKKAHIRQSTLEDNFNWTKISPEEVDSHLNIGQTLEGYRSNFAWLLSYILPKTLQHESFKEYYKDNR